MHIFFQKTWQPSTPTLTDASPNDPPLVHDFTYPRNHAQREDEAGEAVDEGDNLAGVGHLEVVRVLVHDRRDEALDGDELRVDGHDEDHEEEEHGPDGRVRHQGDGLRVNDEGQAGTWVEGC